MTLWPWLILVTAYGACVGSFLNVVILRMPKGESVVHPPSHDPATGDRLQWWENLPILSWLLLRGRSRYTHERISVQYPLVEAFTALAFGGLFCWYYMTDWRPAFFEAGLGATWPVLAVHLTLVAALIAATLIDFRHYIIPLPITWFVVAAALVVLPVSAWVGWLPNLPIELAPLALHVNPPQVHAAPTLNDVGLFMAIGGLLGLLLSLGLMKVGWLPRSFDDEPEIEESDDPQAFLNHPHPRREVCKELLFVGLPLLGMLVGMVAASKMGFIWGASSFPMAVQILGGIVGGYLVGGGIVWMTRIFGTLAFGKEAMGLGDVHLMAGVGAILGPMDVVVAFFIAPFFGLFAAVVLVGLTALLKGKTRIIPYGPYLAGASWVMMIFRLPILTFLGIL